MPASPEQDALAGFARPQGLDPRTKLFVLLITNAALIAYGDAGGFSASRMAFAALGAGFLLSARRYRLLVAFVATYAVAVVADAVWLPVSGGTGGLLLAAVTGVVLRLLPGAAIALSVVRTTEVSQFVAAMQRARLPKAFTIPLAVMLRLFPTIAEEYAQISAALRVRGLSWRGLAHPMRALQWRFVPLLVGAMRIGDDLTAAALSRGLEAPGARTSLRQVRLRGRDLAVAILVLTLATWHLTGMRL